MVMSALGIGIGVGVGLGLASAPWAAARPASSSREGVTADRIEQELRRLLVDGAESKVNFDEFPYYLRFVRSFLRSSVPSLPSFLPPPSSRSIPHHRENQRSAGRVLAERTSFRVAAAVAPPCAVHVGSLTLVHACSFFNRFPSRDFLTRIVHINCVLLICKKKEEK